MSTLPLRVLVVDDEKLARDRIRELLAPKDDVEIVGECKNGREAIQAFQTRDLDLVLLDVQMPELSGIEVLESLSPEQIPAVIFVTAYDEYALKAFELHALDYLLKPFDDDRFEEALERAQQHIRQKQVEGISERLLGLLGTLSRPPEEGSQEESPPDGNPPGKQGQLAVRSGNRWLVIDAEEVDWIEAAGVYVRLIVGDKSHLLRTSLTDLEERLEPDLFMRIHRSTIVNIERIQEIRPYTHGEYVLVLKDETRLKVSRGYSGRVRDYLDAIK